MVKKLFKHEFLAYARVMVVVYIILLTVATAGRIVQIFENDSVAYTIVSVFSGITYGVCVCATITFLFAFSIVRFYKNLFTHEGYLTFTLPVTSSQQIVVKTITTLSFDIITWTAILLSGCIFTAGELLTEIVKAFCYVLEQIFALAGMHTVIIGIELVGLLLLAYLSNILLYYTFISIGQLFKKNRILAAIGAYFVYYIFTQIISTVCSILFSLLAYTPIFEKFILLIARHPYASIHIALWCVILLSGIFAMICFFVIRRIITKKLNLE